ncbi:unnamed protein product [Ilex paraguariensis]|uniref:Uncharacterized protein n=1 Tax=Ilex paraguariensis TaxID=185542 RepID=A0ABC8THC2_9AQUA
MNHTIPSCPSSSVMPGSPNVDASASSATRSRPSPVVTACAPIWLRIVQRSATGSLTTTRGLHYLCPIDLDMPEDSWNNARGAPPEAIHGTPLEASLGAPSPKAILGGAAHGASPEVVHGTSPKVAHGALDEAAHRALSVAQGSSAEDPHGILPVPLLSTSSLET